MDKKDKKFTILRERIAHKAEKWLEENVLEYIPLEGGLSKLSPYKYIQHKMYQNLKNDDTERRFSNLLYSYSKNHFDNTPIQIIEAIKQNQKLVILGDPGSGKTTSIQYLTFQYANDDSQPIPIYIQIQLYRQRNGLMNLIKSYTEVDISDFKDEQFIFFLDGFDELPVSEKNELLIDINKLQTDYKKSAYVITSREASGLIIDWPTYEIHLLRLDTIEKYIKLVLDENNAKEIISEINNHNISNIAEIPQYLTFICKLKRDGHAIPNTKGGILNEIVYHIFLSEESLNKVAVHFIGDNQYITREDCIELISYVAFHIYEITDSNAFKRNQLESILKKKKRPQVSYIIKLMEKLGIIEEHSIVDQQNITHTSFSFKYKTFFEFFIGFHLSTKIYSPSLNTNILENKLNPYFSYKKWDEPLKVLLDLSNQILAERIISVVLEKDIFLALELWSSFRNKASLQTTELMITKLKNIINNCHPAGFRRLYVSIYQYGCRSLIDEVMHSNKRTNNSNYSMTENNFINIIDQKATFPIIWGTGKRTYIKMISTFYAESFNVENASTPQNKVKSKNTSIVNSEKIINLLNSIESSDDDLVKLDQNAFFLGAILARIPEKDWPSGVNQRINKLWNESWEIEKSFEIYFALRETTGKRYYSEPHPKENQESQKISEEHEFHQKIDQIQSNLDKVIDILSVDKINKNAKVKQDDEVVLDNFLTNYYISFSRRKGLIINDNEPLILEGIEYLVMDTLINKLLSDWSDLIGWPLNQEKKPSQIGWVTEKEFDDILPKKDGGRNYNQLIYVIRNKIRGITHDEDGLIENGKKKYDREKQYRLKVHEELIKKELKTIHDNVNNNT